MKKRFRTLLLVVIIPLVFAACASAAYSQIEETPENSFLPLVPADFDGLVTQPTNTVEPPITETPGGNSGPTQTIQPTTDSDELRAIDLGSGSYKGLPLRLQDNGTPSITPVDGIIGVVCVGMSNAYIECRDYIEKWLEGNFDGEVNPQVKFFNCARPSRAIEHWNDPQYDEELWDECRNTVIPSVGYDPAQVRVIWHKAAKMNVFQNGSLPPLYPDPDSDYFRFYEDLTTFAGRVPEKFPSVQAVYVTSRSYGGYSVLPERGEPHAYEEGHALNTWLADNPVVQGVWYGWGPYIWGPDCGSGMTNGSGVCYIRSDYENDGIHPDNGALDKMIPILHDRFRQFDWYND